MSQYAFLGAVERAYRPGCKLDVLPVLVGEQGCGKSTVLRLMFPEDHGEWFSDSLNLAADPKVRAEALQGFVLVEIAEMTGSTRAEIQSLKAFLSRADDGGVRLAYRHNPERLPRRCILFGTSNVAECLPNDLTGNRRFLVVEVAAHERGVAGARQVMNEWREQHWAEALHLHRHGVEARLPENLAAAQAESNETYRAGDTIIEDALDVWLGTAPPRFSLKDVAHGCKLVDAAGGVSKANESKLAALLRARGCAQVRAYVGGKRGRYWGLAT